MPILGIYPTDILADLQNDMSTRLFIAVLFVTATAWKLIGDSLNNLWPIHTMDYYIAIYKKKKKKKGSCLCTSTEQYPRCIFK